LSQVKYYTLKVVLDDADHALLSELAHDGVQEYAIDEEEVDRLLGEKAFSGGDVDENTIALIESQLESNRYLVYFHNEDAQGRAQNAQSLLSENGIKSELSQHDEQDWNEKWREGYETVEISSELWVIPSWHREKISVPKEVTPLYLYPGQGFGTGRHETTSLCLKLFENKKYNNKSVLDFGCGSGILGIAAKLKYNCDVDYMDIDQSALENTKQNLEENNLAIDNKKIIIRSDFTPDQKYDLVFANILLEILIKEKVSLLESLHKQSTLIVSGLLNEHKEAFINQFPELNLVNEVSDGDWCALELVLK
tara:strand:+ start:50 stop:976 length:927 start_codon:yes stop_codon:yes gene_type:complete